MIQSRSPEDPSSEGDWLVVIDAQRVFAEPDSPWHSAGFPGMRAAVERVLPAFGNRVAFTRFLPPPDISGSWRDYYDKWSFADPAADDLWELVVPWQGRPSYDFSTFSKWAGSLRSVLTGARSVALGGVSTDCCVLSTALAAVDDGASVRVVADACAGSSAVLHDAALNLLERRHPQLVVSSVDEELAR